MKKTQNLLFLMFLSLALFTFIPPKEVKAIGEPEIQSITVKQGNTVLTKEGNYYIAPGYDNLEVSYSLVNAGYGYGSYYLEVLDGSEYPISSGWYYPNFVSELWVNLSYMDNPIVTYEIKLCSDWDCETIYDTRTISVNFTKFGTFDDDSIYYTKVMQGGVEITLDNNQGGFPFNNLQDVVFSLKGENLDSAGTYEIECANKSMYYTGNELMNGINHTCIVSDYQYNSFNLNYSIARSGWSIGYFLEEEDIITYPTFYLNSDNNIKAFESTLKYTNYSKELSRIDDDYWGEKYHYLVLSRYLNTTDTMTYNIKGIDFENKNYTVKLTVLKGNENVYTRSLTVSGNDLNSGYDAEFTNFNPGTVSNVRYLFRVTIDDVTAETDIEYIYSSKELVIKKITQGYNETALPISNGAYVADGYDRIYLYFDITNYQKEDELYIKLANGTYSYIPGNPLDLSLDQFEQETDTFTIRLCADSECNTIYTFDDIKIQFTHYNQVKNQQVYFYNVKQGGNTITMDNTGTFNLNDKQLVSMMVKGENLVNDATYTLRFGDRDIYVLGSELTNGVELTGDPQNSGWLSIYFRLGDVTLNELYYDGTTYHEEGCDEYCVYFDFNTENQYNKNYTATLKYKNYPSNQIELDESDWNGFYIINSKYHNNDNPLMYYVKGTGYENKNYMVNVKISVDGETVIYNRDFTVNGNNLNNGTNIDLTNLVLPLSTNIEEIMSGEYGMPIYEFELVIDYVADIKDTKYNSVGADVYVSPEIFFQNGKKNLSVFRGFGNSGMYDTHKDVFQKYSKIYINFLGYNFNDDDEYDYVIDYGYYTENGDVELTYPNRIKTGKVTGKLLNEVGIFVEFDNNQNYKHPSYRFYVIKGNEIVAFTAPVIYTMDKASLGSVILTSQDRDMYLNTGDYSYIATKNMPININVSGIGFDNNKNYDFTFCYAPIYETPIYYDNSICDEITLNGNELNEGVASIAFKEDIDQNAKAYTFYIYGGGEEEDYFGQGLFSVEFVENKALLPTLGKYIIDDASDIIRNIKKQTTASEFKNSITVAEGVTIKVFDKTGTTEVTGQLGTGMQSRIIDEYDRNIINIGIAIKGDITGDGNISLTDLVKVKKHLLETDILEDVYEVAGDVDDSIGISITDLIQMSKDVTGIKELD